MLHSVMPYGMIFSNGTDCVIGQPSLFEADDRPMPQAILSTDPFVFLDRKRNRP